MGRLAGPGKLTSLEFKRADDANLFRCQSFRLDNDRHLISQERLLRKDIDLLEGKGLHTYHPF
jgi:hypothetical protein